MPRYKVQKRTVFDVIDTETMIDDEAQAVNTFRDKTEADDEVNRLQEMLEANTDDS